MTTLMSLNDNLDISECRSCYFRMSVLSFLNDDLDVSECQSEVCYSLESEIEVQHIVNALHIEILRVEAIVSLCTLAVYEAGLLISAGLHIPVVGDVLDVERETEVILTVDIP